MAAQVARGAAFERAALSALGRELGARLDRLGSAHDRGLDLLGRWEAADCWLAAQCKSHLRRKVGSPVLRELEGSLLSLGRPRTLGVLCSHTGFSRAAFEHCRRSAFPLALAAFDDVECSHITGFYTNGALQRLVPTLFVAECPAMVREPDDELRVVQVVLCDPIRGAPPTFCDQ